MARIVNAPYSTLIGTPQQIAHLLGVLKGAGAAVVDLSYSNFVVLDKPLDRARIEAALRTTPAKQAG